jgi:hypothetical protein
MAKRIDPSVERSIIVSRPEKRPYDAKLFFLVLEMGFWGTSNMSLFFSMMVLMRR